MLLGGASLMRHYVPNKWLESSSYMAFAESQEACAKIFSKEHMLLHLQRRNLAHKVFVKRYSDRKYR